MSLHMLSKCGCQGRLGHWGAISTALVCSSLISVRSEIAVCEVGSSRHMCLRAFVPALRGLASVSIDWQFYLQADLSLGSFQSREVLV